jgi:hypothetical protein
MSDLTISQALRNAARLKGKLAEYKTRAAAAVTFKSAEKPAYNFAETVKRIESTRLELIAIEARLAVTNAVTKIEFGGKTMTLTYAVKLLQEHKGELAWLKSLVVRSAQSTNEEETVYVHGGGHQVKLIPMTCDLPEASRSDKVDDVQASFDALNDLVEKKNHETPLHAA